MEGGRGGMIEIRSITDAVHCWRVLVQFSPIYIYICNSGLSDKITVKSVSAPPLDPCNENNNGQ